MSSASTWTKKEDELVATVSILKDENLKLQGNVKLLENIITMIQQESASTKGHFDSLSKKIEDLENRLKLKFDTIDKDSSNVQTAVQIQASKLDQVDMKLKDCEEHSKNLTTTLKRCKDDLQQQLKTLKEAFSEGIISHEKQLSSLLKQQQEKLLKSDDEAELKEAGINSIVIHVCQLYQECDSIITELQNRLPQNSPLKFVAIVPENAGTIQATSPSKTLIYVFFTHSGRWLDDLRGQYSNHLSKILSLYDNLFLVTLRGSTSTTSLPTMDKDDSAVANILEGKKPQQAVYLLFEHKKKVYDATMKTQYNQDAIQYNEVSVQVLLNCLLQLYQSDIVNYERAREMIQEQKKNETTKSQSKKPLAIPSDLNWLIQNL